MQLRSVGLPTLHNYAEALARLENTVAFRSGSYKGRFPLGDNRRYKYCTIAKQYDDSVALQLYDSNVVTFYPNGEIHISLCKYDTVATRQFLWGTLPYDIKHDRGTTYLIINGEWYAFPSADTTLIIKDNVILNAVQEKTYKLNRAVMKDKRSLYQSFLEYVNNMGRIQTGITQSEAAVAVACLIDYQVPNSGRINPIVLPRALSRYYRGGEKPIAMMERFLADVKAAQESNNLDKFYNYFILLGISALRFNYYMKAYVPSYTDDVEVSISKQMLEFFDEILKFVYSKEVFTSKDVPIGVKVSNKNRKYIG